MIYQVYNRNQNESGLSGDLKRIKQLGVDILYFLPDSSNRKER